MDTFIEHIVKQKSTMQKTLLKVLIVLAAIIIVFICFMVIPFAYSAVASISFAVGIGAIYGAYWLISGMSVEYEYAFTNGELDVDKIVARRKRTRLLTVKASTFEKLGEYKPEQHANIGYQYKLFASTDPNGLGAWYAVFRHQKKGLTLLVFDPEERILDSFKRFIPKPLMYEVFGRYGSGAN